MAATDAQKRATAKRNKKCISFACQYQPAEISEAKRLKYYLASTGQSANAYIKKLIKLDLDNQNIRYPQEDDADD